MSKKAYSFWLTDEEAMYLRETLQTLRVATCPAEHPPANPVARLTRPAKLGPGLRLRPDGYPERTTDATRTTEELYAADLASRGRPLKFDLATARAIKRAYWTGLSTVSSLAKEHRCSVPTVYKLVFGYTYPYVETGLEFPVIRK